MFIYKNIIGLFIFLFLTPLITPTFASPSEDVCLTCHYESELSAPTKDCSIWMQNGHPVYITPSKNVVIPPEFPLNDKGQIFCGTCHTAGLIDKQATDLRTKEYTKKVFLRQQNTNSSICKSCHVRQLVKELKQDKGKDLPKDNALPPKGYNHPVDFILSKFPPELHEYGGKMGTIKNMIICETCHRVHRSQDKQLLITDNSRSELCGACHASKNALDRESAARKSTHSVNIIPVQMEISPTVLAQGGKLGKQGRLICLTCHRVHNAPIRQKLLVRPNTRSSFCIECHQERYENIRGSKHDLGLTAPQEKNIIGQSVKQGGICSPCHLAHSGTGSNIWARPLVNNQTDIISQLCNSCHSEGNCAADKTTGKFSHAVGVEIASAGVSRINLPLYSPVGQSGTQVTCATCHNVHRWDPRSTAKQGIARREGNETNSFLRKRNTRSVLCFICHKDKNLIKETEHDPKLLLAAGWNPSKLVSGEQIGNCNPCHTVHNAQASMLWKMELGPGDDDVSRICASCHAPGQIAETKLVGEHSHPVNTSIFNLGNKLKISLPLFNQQGIRDPRGKVFCNTCHDVHRWDPQVRRKGPGKPVEGDASNSFLRVSAAEGKSNLCYKCHEDKTAIWGSKHDISHDSNKVGGICGSCHGVHNAASGIRLWNGKLGTGEDGISQLCNSCHAVDQMAKNKLAGQYSHPVNVKLAKPISSPLLPTYDEDLKIEPEAKVLCSTCHDPHRQNPDNNGEHPDDNFLRVPNMDGYKLCIECHPNKEWVKNTKHDLSLSAPDEKNSRGQTTAQSGVCGACHSVHQAASPLRIWAKPTGDGGDGFSQLCYSCHQPKGCAAAKAIGPMSHPVGVSMTGVEGKTSLPLFNSEGRVDEVKGRVYCNTCHDVHQWNPKIEAAGSGIGQEGHQGNSFLRIADTPQAALCQECHPSALEIKGTPHDLSTSSSQQKIAHGNICSPCHLVHNGMQKTMLWARKSGPQVIKNWDNKLSGSQNQIASLCTSCHSPGQSGQAKQPAYALHPGGMFVIQKQIAADVAKEESGFDYIFGPLKIRFTTSALNMGAKPRFPLFTLEGKRSTKGDITCSTCHNSHRWQPTKNNSTSLTSGFLRPGIATDFCSDCHAYDAIYRFAYYHRAGRTDDSPKIASKSDPHRSGSRSKSCKSCHKPGNATTEVHPVGNEIEENQEIKMPADLPLAANRISCDTCHDLKSQWAENPKLLRLHNAKPQMTFSWAVKKASLYKQNRYVLCYQCHQQEKYLQFSPHKNQINHKGEINQEVCLLCHYELPDRNIANPRKIKLKGPIEQQCIGCHPGKIQSHPTQETHFGKKLSASALKEVAFFTLRARVYIPLTDDRISCPTCHNTHQYGVLRHEITQKGAGEKWMLRLMGHDSCAICHQEYSRPSPGSPW